MRIGVVFPQTEIGSDPAVIRDYAQTVEGLGFSHILAYEHVVGANPNRPEGFQGPYTFESTFHEPFVLFSYLAGLTQKIEFVTGILILPQRQTALVAKQAASLDVISSGRLRLGVGIGWNPVEYVALNENFHNRGKRIEEQVSVLRQLWGQPLVNFQGRWHNIPDAGIKPLPTRQIPIWFGGHAEAVLERMARMGDGWMPGYRTAEAAAPDLDKIAGYMEKAGRNPSELGLEPRLHYNNANLNEWEKTILGWRAVGASHLSINTMGCGFFTPGEHIKALTHFAAWYGLAAG